MTTSSGVDKLVTNKEIAMPNRKLAVVWEGNEVAAKKGLLWMCGKDVGLPLADMIAYRYGFSCAERLVEALEDVTP